MKAIAHCSVATPYPTVMNLALRGIGVAREMRRDELRLPNEAPSSSFILHPPHFMITFPGQLFYSTQIPVCLWFAVKRNALEASNDSRLFDGETELNLVA